MSEIECGLCWREANLTQDQLMDPANAITETIRLCAPHQQTWDRMAEILEKWGQVNPFIPGSHLE